MAAAAASNNAAAAALVANPAMGDYFENTLGFTNNHLRGHIIRQGFSSLGALVRKPKDFVSKAAAAIRKLPGSVGLHMTLEVEETLQHLYLYAKYMYMVQRNAPFDLALATPDHIQAVADWISQLDEGPTMESLPKFTNNTKFRFLLEKLHEYLASKTGAAGVPLLYLMREDSAVPNPDQGPWLPDYATELQQRGRHAGFFYTADNRTLWKAISHITHGTMPGLLSSLATRVPMAEEPLIFLLSNTWVLPSREQSMTRLILIFMPSSMMAEAGILLLTSWLTGFKPTITIWKKLVTL